ncbi:MAG: glycoside hydrolase [Tannerella sp.]|jgi:alpha-L-arabinofuranosidase|nr:glycoside hydrolase [Tannerella sp.]
MKDIRFEYQYVVLLLCLCVAGCKPIAPVTSDILIDLEKPVVAVNRELYGLTLEEINHAIEGGIYGEMIQNRSFEDGVLPTGCTYDQFANSLTTPSGWTVPFVSPNTVPGWRTLTSETQLFIDTWSRPINEFNERSLWVYVPFHAKGGVVAEGFGGINVRKGEKYDLSLYIRGQRHSHINVELRDSMAGRALSDAFTINYAYDWTRVHYIFTATDSDPSATLVFSADSSALFNLDIVSLFPQDTWHGRTNGFRRDLMEALEALNPRFVRFAGGASVEGYASSALADWQETLRPIEERRHLWGMYGYGVNQGVGLNDFLQLSEDLDAKPVYVVNAGLLNQRYRTRYQDKPMDYWTSQLTSALAYANEPTDSVYGSLRQSQGHSEPYRLDRIEIGSEHRGREYLNRYRQLREAVGNRNITLISNSIDGVRDFSREWIDTHFNLSPDYLIACHNIFDMSDLTLQTPMRFVGEFGASFSPEAGTLRAAVGEAAFLIGAERNPQNVKGIAYSPLLGHAAFPLYGKPAILFDASRIAKSPSYYVMQMFADNRGDDLLVTNVKTYDKPQVNVGGAAVILFDYQFGVKDIAWNGEEVKTAFVRDDRINNKWSGQPVRREEVEILSLPEGFDFEKEQSKVVENREVGDARGQPSDVFRRYMFFGDGEAYNYRISVNIKEVQAGGTIEIHVRDNGEAEELSDYISLTFRNGRAGLYHCGGKVERQLTEPVPVNFTKDVWYRVEIVCADNRIQCYIDGTMIINANVPSRPTLLTVATRENETNTVILKVVNTTLHEEWCSINVAGGSFRSEVEVIQLAGRPDAQNTLMSPEVITPTSSTRSFSFNRPITYPFPANSVTIFRLKMK